MVKRISAVKFKS